MGVEGGRNTSILGRISDKVAKQTGMGECKNYSEIMSVSVPGKNIMFGSFWRDQDMPLTNN